MTQTLRNFLFLVVAALVVFGSGFATGYRYALRTPEVVTDTVYVDRPLAPSDTAQSSTPDQTVIYLPSETPPVVIRVPSPPELIRDSVIVERTRTETVYRDSVAYDTTVVYRDVEYDYAFKLLPENGVYVTSGRTRVTAFDPNLRTWTQDVYDHPKRRDLGFELDLYASDELEAVELPRLKNLELGARGTLDLGRFAVELDPHYNVAENTGIVRGTLLYNIFGDR